MLSVSGRGLRFDLGSLKTEEISRDGPLQPGSVLLDFSRGFAESLPRHAKYIVLA